MPEEILQGIFDITCEQSNGRRYRAFLSTRGVPTLFDTGFKETIKTLFEGIEEIGVKPERMVITHGHADHIEGFDAVVDKYGVETWVPTETSVDVVHQPDHRYEDEEKIGRFEAVHVPGHAPGNSALVDEGLGDAILGDVVFGSDLRGLPAGYPVLPPEVYSKDMHAAERNLKKLLKYDFTEALVYHGSPLIENARAKLERYANFPGKPE